jgi:hypothetical protein
MWAPPTRYAYATGWIFQLEKQKTDCYRLCVSHTPPNMANQQYCLGGCAGCAGRRQPGAVRALRGAHCTQGQVAITRVQRVALSKATKVSSPNPSSGHASCAGRAAGSSERGLELLLHAASGPQPTWISQPPLDTALATQGAPGPHKSRATMVPLAGFEISVALQGASFASPSQVLCTRKSTRPRTK